MLSEHKDEDGSMVPFWTPAEVNPSEIKFLYIERKYIEAGQKVVLELQRKEQQRARDEVTKKPSSIWSRLFK